MKARTKFKFGEVFFAYENEYGDKFRNYNELLADYYKNGNVASGGCIGYVTGYLKSNYAGCTERIDEMPIKYRPDVSKVKEFMRSCIDFILNC